MGGCGPGKKHYSRLGEGVGAALRERKARKKITEILRKTWTMRQHMRSLQSRS